MASLIVLAFAFIGWMWCPLVDQARGYKPGELVGRRIGEMLDRKQREREDRS